MNAFAKRRPVIFSIIISAAYIGLALLAMLQSHSAQLRLELLALGYRIILLGAAGLQMAAVDS
jgi:hypothetical protein